jgi:hypothetical protein
MWLTNQVNMAHQVAHQDQAARVASGGWYAACAAEATEVFAGGLNEFEGARRFAALLALARHWTLD